VLDHVQLEQRGIPTVTVVTEPFLSAARTHAALGGLADLPLVVVPQDYLVGVSDEEVIERDQAVFDQILAAVST
jgi:hypothetical protein